MAGFSNLTALTHTDNVERASIPFDRERSGFVMGEGAGILLLETYESAMERGAHIYAEVLGYGATTDAYHMTAPSPDGSGTARAMQMALDQAGISAEKVDYINTHGTSTPANDSTETNAIHTVFGEDTAIPVSSTKSMTGHLLGAAGAVETAVCALAIHDGFIPANIHYKEPDPECNLNIVTGNGLQKTVSIAMKNAMGFGGHNAALLLGAFDRA
jgi:3-oxoacyl-[acyl-carrier-protein] synthase II